MIETIQDTIISGLETISGIAAVGAWQGDIEDLLKTPQRLPALQVIYQGAVFEGKKAIGVNMADHQMGFLVVLVAKNFKSRSAGAVSCYTIIEGVRSKLIGLKINPYGYLWPAKEELLMAEGGLLLYGLSYNMDTDVTV